MRRAPDGTIVYAPTDLVTYLRSPFASWMERLRIERPGVAEPDPESEDERLVKAMGLRHEEAFLESCREDGDVGEIADGRPEDRFAATRAEMAKGRRIVYQAALATDGFAGYADFLEKVDGRSRLGSYHYEVADTKLGRQLKPEYVIQLCAYAEMLEAMQGCRPKNVHVVLGTRERRTLRTDDLFFAYLAIKRAFLEEMVAFDPDRRPAPDPKDDHGRWASYVERWVAENDHLSRVAGITRGQIVKLEAAGIATLESLATGPLARVPKIAPVQLEKLHAQARLQRASHGRHTPEFELVPPKLDEPRRGLALLPPPSHGDAWIDFEGYPLDDSTLYYLFGATTLDRGRPSFRDWWAHDRAQEKKSFEEFVDFLHARWRADSGMHLYHYGAYEVTALRTLMGMHGTRESEVDDLLRAEVFVDLLVVVRQGVRVGTPRYSLKDVERLYRPPRAGEVATAGESIVAYHSYLETGDTKSLDQIRAYNEDDCESTRQLADWLRARQQEAGIEWVEPVRIRPESEEDDAKVPRADAALRVDEEAAALAVELLGEIPAEEEVRGRNAARWDLQEILSQILEFHRRELKPVWWAMFDRRAKPHEDLAEDPDCLGMLRLESGEPETVRRSKAWWYRFDPDQDTKLEAGSKIRFAHDLAVKGRIETLGRDEGRVQITIGSKFVRLLSGGRPPDLLSVIPDEIISPDVLRAAILDVVTDWRVSHRLARHLGDLLSRHAARVEGHVVGPLLQPGEDSTDGAVRIGAGLDRTTLCIQGPPGTGKTHTGAEMILDLIGRGKRVGITATSHKAIETLLGKCCELAQAPPACIKVGGDDRKDLKARFPRLRWEDPGSAAQATDVPLVCGTAWFFARPDVAAQFDHLFVDEAGQFALANLVAVSRAAKNLVLLGDQLQLGQPTRGAHPGDSGKSALEYVLDGQPTIRPDFGIFLEKTRRLHPRICKFISAAIYEDRLEPLAGVERRVVRVGGRARRVGIDAGLLFVPVEHDGNAQASDEEVAVVCELFDELVGREHVDKEFRVRRVTRDDILVVAPYNMQVRRLKAKLSGARIGSVDLFQGQEAPIVIVSMCASDAESSPRGIEFLFSKNRLNVAISRAMSLAIVVGNPALTRARCSSVDQMALVNTFCRIVSEGSRGAERGA